MKSLATILAVITIGGTAMAQTAIESKDAQLSGAPMPGQAFTYGGYPVSNVVAYGLSHANDTPSASNMGRLVSPFSDSPSYAPYNTKLLREAILRAAKAIVEHPNKSVWTVQMRDGEIALYVGDYGNVNASVSFGAISGTGAAGRDLAFVNGTMTDHNEDYKSRGKPEPYPDAKPVPPITEVSDGWWEKLKHTLSRS